MTITKLSITLLLTCVSAWSACTSPCVVAFSMGELSDPTRVDSNPVTTTTATSLFIITSTNNGNTTWSVSDNKSNTFQHLTLAYDTNAQNVQLHYCITGCNVGTNHIFTVSGGSGANSTPTISGAAFTGTWAYDTPNQSGFGSNSLTVAPSSITPSVPNCLVIAGAGFYAFGVVTGVGSSFNLASANDGTTGLFQTGIAYIVQTSAIAANPLFTAASGTFGAAVSASFKPSSGGVSIVPRRLL